MVYVNICKIPLVSAHCKLQPYCVCACVCVQLCLCGVLEVEEGKGALLMKSTKLVTAVV